MDAMRLMKAHKLPFGISACYTSRNSADISSEKFFDEIISAGALFVWFFHYMPVGSGAAPELLPTPEQRTELYRRIRAFRQTKAIFSMDFQNDAEYVGGCIAGGRRYLHINARAMWNLRFYPLLQRQHPQLHAAGSAEEPAVHGLHDGQPFNGNMLRPCPIWRTPKTAPDGARYGGAVHRL